MPSTCVLKPTQTPKLKLLRWIGICYMGGIRDTGGRDAGEDYRIDTNDKTITHLPALGRLLPVCCGTNHNNNERQRRGRPRPCGNRRGGKHDYRQPSPGQQRWKNMRTPGALDGYQHLNRLNAHMIHCRWEKRGQVCVCVRVKARGEGQE